MTSSINLQQLPSNVPSMCIPFVFPNITQRRIGEVFDELHLGRISHIDIIQRTDKDGKPCCRAFIHLDWNTSPEACKARTQLLQDKEIKVIYDKNQWFWKVRANHAEKRTFQPPPPMGPPPGPRIQYDQDDFQLVSRKGYNNRGPGPSYYGPASSDRRYPQPLPQRGERDLRKQRPPQRSHESREVEKSMELDRTYVNARARSPLGPPPPQQRSRSPTPPQQEKRSPLFSPTPSRSHSPHGPPPPPTSSKSPSCSPSESPSPPRRLSLVLPPSDPVSPLVRGRGPRMVGKSREPLPGWKNNAIVRLCAMEGDNDETHSVCTMPKLAKIPRTTKLPIASDSLLYMSPSSSLSASESPVASPVASPTPASESPAQAQNYNTFFTDKYGSTPMGKSVVSDASSSIIVKTKKSKPKSKKA